MSSWPQTIPYDLYQQLESSDHGAWLAVVLSWAESTGLDVTPELRVYLATRVGELDRWKWAPSSQDRWGAIRDCLIIHSVKVPGDLAQAPQQPFVGRGH